MPDNTRPPRQLAESRWQPTLGARAVMNAIEVVGREKELEDFRVAYKRNARGEHVVALIWRA